MNDRQQFLRAVIDLTEPSLTHGALCRPFVTGLPVTRAAISTLAEPFGTATVCASDPEAARLDELQIDLGEGPGWDALASARPVIEPNIQNRSDATWPALSKVIRDSQLQAVFAFPLIVGTLRVGAVDLYSDTAGPLSQQQIGNAGFLSALVARYLVRTALTRASIETGDEEALVFSRREVHQATGMVLAQLRVSPEDALLILRARAFATGQTVREVASDVVARRYVFTPEPLGAPDPQKTDT